MRSKRKNIGCSQAPWLPDGGRTVRGFLAITRHTGEKGLGANTGGISRATRYEAERAGNPLTPMDLDGQVEAIPEHYEAMDLATRVRLALMRIGWPGAIQAFNE